MRIVGYVRVSTDEQTASGAGMAAQRDAIAREAERRGWDVVAIHEDGGASGRSLDGRPGLSAALSAVAAGEADVVVVAKLDRLSRSLIDFAGLLERARREGWAVVALDLGVDTTTPAGELVANVMAAVAQWERRVIGERTKAALAVRRAEGVRLGRPCSIPDSIRARILDERAHGLTLRAIAAGLDRHGIPTSRGGARWHPETIRQVVRQERALSSPARPTPGL
jgi:DNA invertase Pin-like site-specific DNA recombinase